MPTERREDDETKAPTGNTVGALPFPGGGLGETVGDGLPLTFAIYLYGLNPSPTSG